MTVLLSLFVLATSTFAAPSAPFAPVLCASAPAAVEQALFASGGTVKSFCSADCGADPPISCTASVCSAFNRSCTAERGHIVCDGVTFWCPTACACTEGTFKLVATGPNCSCEIEGGSGYGTPKDRYKCIGGVWVYQSSSCGGPFCPGF